MSFSRHTSRIYMDADDVNGTLNVLSKRINANSDSPAQAFYLGAHLLLNLINNHEELRDQSVVMALFDREIEGQGYEVNKEME